MTNTDEIREFVHKVIRHTKWYQQDSFRERLDALLSDSWTSVDEALPEPRNNGTRKVLATNGEDWTIAIYQKSWSGDHPFRTINATLNATEVTHWMYPPELPDTED